ncbi:MAG: ABC transporter permease [Beijerinckiaceae bacterium]
MSENHSAKTFGYHHFGESRPASVTWLKGMRELGPFAALLLISIGFAVVAPGFRSLVNLQTILEASAVPLVIATGLTFVLILGAIDLSIEGVTALASISVSLLVANDVNSNQFGFSAVAFVLLMATAFGLLNGLLLVGLQIPSLMVTLSTWFIGLGIAALLFPGRVPAVKEPSVAEMIQDRLLGFSPIFYCAVGIVVLAHLILNYTTLGRSIYAIGGDERIARLSGVKVRRYKVGAFVIAGFCSGVAGVFLTSQLGYGMATMGIGMSFPAISAAVIGGTLLSGGKGGAMQTAVGVLILGVLNNGLIQVGADPYLRQAVEGFVIIAAVTIGTWNLRKRLRVVK